MNILKQIVFGFKLTKLTNIFFKIERIKKFNAVNFELHELSPASELEIEELVVQLIKTIETIKDVDPYIVTRELIKNMRLTESSNQSERLNAQNRLYEFLTREGVCMYPEEFMAVYYTKKR